MRKYINFDTLVGFSGGNNKGPSYPLRVGRKQKIAVLDANGIEIVIFQKGQEQLAQLTCDLLNHQNNEGLPFLLDKLKQRSDRYMEAENFIIELAEMNFFQRLFSFKKIINFLKSRDKFNF